LVDEPTDACGVPKKRDRDGRAHHRCRSSGDRPDAVRCRLASKSIPRTGRPWGAQLLPRCAAGSARRSDPSCNRVPGRRDRRLGEAQRLLFSYPLRLQRSPSGRPACRSCGGEPEEIHWDIERQRVPAKTRIVETRVSQPQSAHRSDNDYVESSYTSACGTRRLFANFLLRDGGAQAADRSRPEAPREPPPARAIRSSSRSTHA